MRLHLTDLGIKAIKPIDKQIDYFCTTQRNFGIRVSPAGTKTFFLLTGTPKRRYNLGRYPATSLSQARQLAKQQLARPGERHAPVAFAEAVQTYLRTAVQPNYRPKGAKEVERLLTKHAAPLYHLSLREVTTRHCTTIIESLLSTPSEANHFFAALRTFFLWAQTQQLLDKSPLANQSKPTKEKQRDRLLTDEEVRLIWHQSYNHNSFGALIRLLLLTGQRLNQIASLQAAWVQPLNTIVFPAYIMKGNAEHTIPLTPLTQQHLIFFNKPFISFSSAMKRFREALPTIPHFTLHDFRRYFSSTMARLGVPLDVTEALLAHKSGSRSPIQRTYDRYNRLEPMRAALTRYEAHLTCLVG